MLVLVFVLVIVLARRVIDEGLLIKMRLAVSPTLPYAVADTAVGNHPLPPLVLMLALVLVRLFLPALFLVLVLFLALVLVQY